MSEYILDWNKYTDTAIRIAEEGSVLLKNDREALPVNGGAKVALFGRMHDPRGPFRIFGYRSRQRTYPDLRGLAEGASGRSGHGLGKRELVAAGDAAFR